MISSDLGQRSIEFLFSEFGGVPLPGETPRPIVRRDPEESRGPLSPNIHLRVVEVNFHLRKVPVRAGLKERDDKEFSFLLRHFHQPYSLHHTGRNTERVGFGRHVALHERSFFEEEKQTEKVTIRHGNGEREVGKGGGVPS